MAKQRILVVIDERLVRVLKGYSSLKGLTMSENMEHILREYIDSNNIVESLVESLNESKIGGK